MDTLIGFLHQPKLISESPLSAVSLFSGAGLSDSGYEQAGFKFFVQAELDKNRAALCKENYPDSEVVIGKLTETSSLIVQSYQEKHKERLCLLSITPPCQGMSSSNPGRGKISNPSLRDERNRLLLDSVPVIQALQPRVVVAENVEQVLKEEVETDGVLERVIEVFEKRLTDYRLFSGIVQMADYGIPQTRKRAILVAIHHSESCLDEIL